MPSKELIDSWKRTTAYLMDARSHLPQSPEGVCADAIHEFEEFLGYNELELALDSLAAAWEESDVEDLRGVELMAFAAASMGLWNRVQSFDEYLSKTRGVPYNTKL
jgi:hypothetical protein